MPPFYVMVAAILAARALGALGWPLPIVWIALLWRSVSAPAA